ncbi:23S rRNA pseudouridine2605 synthase [Methylobacterium sp. UNC378MF]|uniref:pseudouridine synthase n=1 Tax=Methylobacterium sp. UNC378MF TaxID=1502748 RepID=UPI000881C8A8|nr:pseudouridine synthase [Methylobacterium sp. UNC378MF]SDA23229.1 23S rRNA pseudouridine2605 synthase [Methylobacterium sp. UNC378MF]
MSDLPNDDKPEGTAGPAPETTRTGGWTPPTDAGSADTEREPGAKSAAKKTARKSPQTEPDPPTDEENLIETPPGERIAKAMARAGVASRRDAETMILAGRVSVNGEILTSPALNVTENDRILIDGEPMPSRERSRLWIFHKPRGLVTTARDPEGRQTVFDVLPEDLPRVVAVGRLDINTEGLLLLTNDGGLAKVIAHPDTGWLRRYRVRAHGDTDQAQLDKLARGVTIDGMEYGPVEATLDRVQGDNVWLTLGLREGKNREVKRILEHLGLSVNRLIRLSFGPFQLGDLEVGLVEEVRTRVLKDQLGKSLAEQAGVDFDSPVRDPIAPFGGAPSGDREARATKQTPARRDAARPAPAPRVSTGGSGSGPRNSTWRDEGAAKPRGTRIPRRGADPRAAQASAAERGRERVGSIRAGERRVVVERLAATPAEAAPAERPRRRFADKAGMDRPERNSGPRAERGAGERPRRDTARHDGMRDDARFDERRTGKPGDRRERPFDSGSAQGASRKPEGFRGQRPAPAGGKPAFGGPKAGGPRPGGARPGGKPGGFGGKGPGRGPGNGPGAGGGRPGGRPGAPRGGAKPGGGGRPPRGTR